MMLKKRIIKTFTLVIMVLAVNCFSSDMLLLKNNTKNLSGMVAKDINPVGKAFEWKNAAKGAACSLVPIKKDWSKYQSLSFKLYSSKKNNSGIMITCDSNPTSKHGNYYYIKIKQDWIGWKQFDIPLNKFKVSRKPEGWKHIFRLLFHTKGWGLTPDKDVKFYFKEIKLTGERLTFTEMLSKKYQLVWADEFNEGKLNDKFWTVRDAKRADAISTPEAVSFKDGKLIITISKKDNLYYTADISTEKYVDTEGGGNKLDFLYGYFEAKMKLPKGVGNNPAFWLNSKGMIQGIVNDLAKGGAEIDISNTVHYIQMKQYIVFTLMVIKENVK